MQWTALNLYLNVNRKRINQHTVAQFAHTCTYIQYTVYTCDDATDATAIYVTFNVQYALRVYRKQLFNGEANARYSVRIQRNI